MNFARDPFHCFVRLVIAGLAIFFATGSSAQAAPRHVYLTWQGDTGRTITVNYQTMSDAESSDVYYDTEPRKGEPDRYHRHAIGTHHKIEGLQDGRTIHWVELPGLSPGKSYYFIAGDPKNGFSAERKFHTISSGREAVGDTLRVLEWRKGPIPIRYLTRGLVWPFKAVTSVVEPHASLRFVDGGDMGISGDFFPLLSQAALQEPDFAVIGGDIPYAEKVLDPTKWDAWLDAWEQRMVTPKGYTVPMVLAIGNHEVNGGFGKKPKDAPIFYGFFAQNKECGYFSRRFGNNLILLILDSGHTAPWGGDQAAWLDAELEKNKDVAYKFASYHVPLYPTSRPPEDIPSANGRKEWLPIFDKHHLTTAFEHHDHTFKRTKLLRGDKEDPKGTLYLGDGCWGKPARPVKEPKWYDAKSASLPHFWRVDVTRKKAEYRAINRDGVVFDVYPPETKDAKRAEDEFVRLSRSAKNAKPGAEPAEP